MNKSSREYQRNQKTNSFNQDFIYYKYSKDLSKSPTKSPKFKKLSVKNDEITQNNNHSKIQSMKNTLNTLFDPQSKVNTKSFHKSVAEYDFKRKPQLPKNTKSVYQEDYSNANFNNKLQMLTSKLRTIAQKPHFTTLQDSRKIKYKQKAQPINESYLANVSLIQKESDIKKNSNFQQLFLQQKQKLFQNNKSKPKSGQNFSQQLSKSKILFSNSIFDQNSQNLSNSKSQTNSIKREIKELSNQKSITNFHFPQKNSPQFETYQRPRGKTVTNILQSPLMLEDIQQTKIKINSYIENRQPSKSFHYSKNSMKQAVQKDIEVIEPHIVKILKPHRGPITSVIINSDGRRFLSSSNDYFVKQTNLDGTSNLIRKHEGRVNIMKMIDDKLFSGGNDCKLKYEKQSFLFSSPVLEIYPHQKTCINVGTSSSVQLFDMVKRLSIKSIKVKTKFYNLCQKVNKQVYFLDNHSLSVIDWRVPFPLINLIQQENYIQKWISDPYTLDFYQIRNNQLIYTNNSKSAHPNYQFQDQLRDYCWKKDRVYFLTEKQLKIFENRRNQLVNQYSICLDDFDSKPTKIHVKNDIWVCGTNSGSLIVNKFH